MRYRSHFLPALLLVLASTVEASEAASQPFVEVVGVLGGFNGLVELKDGSLLSTTCQISTDGGKTWDAPLSFGDDISGSGILRLQSGALALVQQVGYQAGTVWISDDEGKSWKKSGSIKTGGGPCFAANDAMIQTKDGRFVCPWDLDLVGEHTDVNYQKGLAFGIWKGQRYAVEGHGHLPEFYGTVVSCSDDGGETWTFDVPPSHGVPNALFGWFDSKGEVNGNGGITPCGESSVAETNDGRLLLFGRSSVGRIVYSYSTDGGRFWSAVRPTPLASSESPPRLRRIPKTGDLLCVWNQVSRDEIKQGYRRGRLSAAISKDRGATWENFKTIEVSDGLEKVAWVPIDEVATPIRSDQEVGQLPDGFAYFHYANVCFAGDKVYVMYQRGRPELGNAEQVLNVQESVLRIYPLDWFYE